MNKRSQGTTTFGALLLLWSVWETYQVYSALHTLSTPSTAHELESIGSSRAELLSEARVAALGTGVTILAWVVAGIGILKRRNWARIVALCTASILVIMELATYHNFIADLPSEYLLTYFPDLSHPLRDPLWSKRLAAWCSEFMRCVHIGVSGLAPVWYGAIIWYFLRPSVRSEFRQSGWRN